jgi:aryl-alcohol dehydrogenase-like predicted oxidoreductase
MWGVGGGPGGWTGSDDEICSASLQAAVDLGCTFFDTAWIYGRGHSELLLGEVVRGNPGTDVYVATKIPPLDRRWPPAKGVGVEAVFPTAHVQEYVARSLDNVGLDRIDLLQYHVWEDRWADDPQWLRQVEQLRSRPDIGGIGISINRWEPSNVLKALRTGLVDAVQVIYNIFDQAPEDALFDACQELGIAVIARVPFDEGTLTGTLTMDSTWPDSDWRASYFVPENLAASVERAERLAAAMPASMTMPELALRFILHHPAVNTVIPGMRSLEHVRANISVSDGTALPGPLIAELRRHRWDRVPTEWSQ